MATLRLLGRPAFGDRRLPVDRRGGLLCYLAFSGEWMSRDELASLFWPESDQAAARRNLRQLLSRTKQLDDAENLEVTGDMARWRVDTDLARFREAVAGEDWLVAVERYYGDLLEDFEVPGAVPFDRWLSTERESLRNAYREAAMRGAVMLENSGRYHEACRHLGVVLEADPLAEDVLQLYLRNLYLSGRRDSAVQAYDRFEARLAEEVGMAPLQRTTELIAAIRAAEPLRIERSPTEEADQRTPLQIVRPPRLVGRQGAVDSVLAAGQPLVLLKGEAGIGKSRLLEELAPAATVLRCRESLVAVPFQPVVGAIREHLAGGGTVPELGGYREDLARLVPELAEDEPGSAPQDDGDKSRLLTGLAHLFESLALAADDGAADPFALVIDDLQWADNATLELLALLLERGSLRVLGAYRTHEPSPALTAALREARRTGRLAEVELAPLGAADFEELLLQLNDSPGADSFGGWLHARTGGNPMFALETLRSLHDARRLAANLSWQELADALEEQYLPPSAAVSDVIAARVERLDEASRRVLEAAAVVAQDFEPRLLSGVCGLSEWAVVDALDDAESNGLTLGRGFRHDLIRQAIYHATPSSRLGFLHGRVLDELAASPGRISSALLARHAIAARRPEEAARYSIAAGLEALSLPAYRDAAAHFRTALEHAPAAAARALALEGLGDALVQLYRSDEAVDAFRSAGSDMPQDDVTGLARLKRKSHLAHARAAREDAAIGALREALALLETAGAARGADWRHEWIEVQLAVAGWHYGVNQLDAMSAAVESLGPVVLEHGSAQQRSRYFRSLAMLYSRQERYRISERTLEVARRALEAVTGSAERQLLATQRFSLGFLALWSGELDLAQEQLQLAAAFAERQDELTMQMQTQTYLTILARFRRDLEATEAHLCVALGLAKRHGHLDYEAAGLANRAWLELTRGEPEAATASARAALEIWLTRRAGRYPFYWLACLPLLDLAIAADDVDTAAQQAGLMVDVTQQALAPDLTAALEAGLAAHRARDLDGARSRLQEAVDLARRERLL